MLEIMEELKDKIKKELEKIQNMINEDKPSEEIEKQRKKLDKYLLAYTQDLKEKKKK